MSDIGAKQQIVDKIKSNTNILVTVSNDPSVDELSAALGLTLLLNKMKKHATAVFSGQIPAAINFLDPAKTFENTVDSLRDFIIALDKEKADHLRYKIDGDVVKIFITPYRTTITNDDLDFSQGDYNVEMVIALGVKTQDNLDNALEAHGRILHDAVVATVTAGPDKSKLGSIDWHEEGASSISELMVSLCESLKGDKTLLDEQIATAFLSGIVAATERFSNNRTSARVMTMAAQLMGAGANQQLIASKFEEASGETDPDPVTDAASDDSTPPVEAAIEEPNIDDEPSQEHVDGTTDLSEGESTKLDRDETADTPKEHEASAPVETEEQEGPESPGGTLNVSHEKEGTLEEVAEQTAAEGLAEAAKAAEDELTKQSKASEAVKQAAATKAAEEELASQLPPVVAPKAAGLSVEDLQKDIASASAEVTAAAAQTTVADTPLKGAVSSEVWKNAAEPTFGGTLNATTEQAEEASHKAEEEDRNKTILSHSSYIGTEAPTYNAPFNAASMAADEPSISNPIQDAAPYISGSSSTIEPLTLADLDKQNRSQQTVSPDPEFAGLPPLPDFSTLPPLPQIPGSESSESVTPATPVQPPVTQDPGQFRIPGAPAS